MAHLMGKEEEGRHMAQQRQRHSCCHREGGKVWNLMPFLALLPFGVISTTGLPQHIVQEEPREPTTRPIPILSNPLAPEKL